MQSKYIAVNGINLHYMEEGQGELVILLHGFPEFWYGWRLQIPVFSKKYRVVALDMRGYNLSDKPTGISNYKMGALATDIKEVIKGLGEESAIVVGHDWGAAVAWGVATEYPKVVRKLAILNVPHPAEMRRAFLTFNLSQWAKSYYIFFFQLPAIPEWFIARDLRKFFMNVFRNMSPRKKNADLKDVQAYVDAYSKPGAINAAVNYYRAAMRNMNSMKASEKLKMPVLMIWGEQDTALGKELTYRTGEYCEQLEIVYDPTSGHFVQQDNPQLVNEKLMEFFEK